jgi:hypothetical protein
MHPISHHERWVCGARRSQDHALLSALRQCSDKVASRTQMLLVFDPAKIAHEIKERGLRGRPLDGLIRAKAVEKIFDRRAQRARELVQEGGRYGIFPQLVLKDHLLRHSADDFSELPLAQTKQDSALANSGADKSIEGAVIPSSHVLVKGRRREK